MESADTMPYVDKVLNSKLIAGKESFVTVDSRRLFYICRALQGLRLGSRPDFEAL
jgi:hypothetical protein